MRAEDMICSKKCEEIFKETWKNADKNCKCGKEATIHFDDYKTKTVKSFCEGCFYRENQG